MGLNLGLAILAFFALWFFLLFYGNGVDDIYYSTGSKYHIGCCFLVNENNVGCSFNSKHEAEENGLTPCRLCVHDNRE